MVLPQTVPPQAMKNTLKNISSDLGEKVVI